MPDIPLFGYPTAYPGDGTPRPLISSSGVVLVSGSSPLVKAWHTQDPHPIALASLLPLVARYSIIENDDVRVAPWMGFGSDIDETTSSGNGGKDPASASLATTSVALARLDAWCASLTPPAYAPADPRVLNLANETTLTDWADLHTYEQQDTTLSGVTSWANTLYFQSVIDLLPRTPGSTNGPDTSDCGVYSGAGLYAFPAAQPGAPFIASLSLSSAAYYLLGLSNQYVQYGIPNLIVELVALPVTLRVTDGTWGDYADVDPTPIATAPITLVPSSAYAPDTPNPQTVTLRITVPPSRLILFFLRPKNIRDHVIQCVARRTFGSVSGGALIHIGIFADSWGPYTFTLRPEQ